MKPWACLGLLLMGCVTAPARLPDVARRWPAAPAPARLAWAASFPDERAQGPAPGFWRRVLNAFLGLDEDGARAEALLARPFGLAAAGAAVLVADPDGRRVVRIDWQTGTFEALACPRAWAMPLAVAAAPDGAVYVADGGTGRVVRHTASGCTELGAGLLTRPSGLALWGEQLYVVDPPQHQVLVFTLAGALVRRFGGRGDGPGQLNYPTAIAVRPDGAVLVVDALNFRVVTYSAEGAVLSTFGQAGERDGAFARPKGVALDAAGRIYVSDAQLGAVLVFDPAGQFQLGLDGSGREPYEFSLPAGVAVAGDKLFVADAYHHRVEMYDILPEAP